MSDALGAPCAMSTPAVPNDYVWQILEIEHDRKMLRLISNSTPTVKRFGVPDPIEWAEVTGPYLKVYCQGFVAWEIQISNGARRKFKHTVRSSETSLLAPPWPAPGEPDATSAGPTA